MHQFHTIHCGLRAAENPLQPTPKELHKQWHSGYACVSTILCTKEKRILLKLLIPS